VARSAVNNRYHKKIQPDTLNTDDDPANAFDKNYLAIDRLCENEELFQMLLKLSCLSFLKYNFTRGLIVCALVESHGNNFLDKDVLLKTIDGRDFP
jgi:hypothetical protein